MNIQHSEPIAIRSVRGVEQSVNSSPSTPNSVGRIQRQRHDTITRIKDAFGFRKNSGQLVSPHLSSPTPPTFVPDGSHEISRIGEYLLVEQVEGHNSGNVFRAVNIHTDAEFICKVYELSEYRKPLEAYSRIEPHPNINQVVEIIHGTTKAYVFFQPGVPQRKMNGGTCEQTEGFKADNLHNLTRTQGRLPEEVAAAFFTQVVEAVSHCHENNIVIRDLKLRKFIFRDEERKLVMLESLEDAHVLTSEGEGVKSKHGCIAYISPETLASSAAALSSGDQNENKVNGFCAKASDVWSLGIMLYTMLVGRYPFQESEPSTLFSKICRGKFDVPDSLSSESRDLIHNLLRRDPATRFRSSDILHHPWVKKRGKCWDRQRFVMPLGSGGDVRIQESDLNLNFRSVPPSRKVLYSSACAYADQVVPDSYVSEEDETMFE